MYRSVKLRPKICVIVLLLRSSVGHVDQFNYHVVYISLFLLLLYST